MTYGKNNNSVKKGSWGDKFLLEKNYSTKKPSCYTCKYCIEKKSCKKIGDFIPNIGSSFWKQCKYFILSNEYYSEINFNIINSVKGHLFLENMFENIENKQGSVGDNILNSIHVERKVIDFSKLNIEILDSEINLITNICFKCIEKRINPTKIFLEADKLMDKYLESKKELDLNYISQKNKAQKEMLQYIHIIAGLLKCNVDDLILILNEEKEKILNDFFNDKNYYCEKDLMQYSSLGDRFFKLSREYQIAENDIFKSGNVHKYENKETRELIPIKKWEEKWDLYIDSFENSKLYGIWIIFLNPSFKKLKYFENDAFKYYLYFQVIEYYVDKI